MKLKLTNAASQYGKGILKLSMRIFIMLFCGIVFGIAPDDAFSQKSKITIDEDRTVSIDEVFNLFKAQTDYTFIYPSDFFKDAPTVELKKGTIRADELLKSCLLDKGYGFTFKKNKIIIFEKSIPRILLQDFTVTGTILDNDGLPLPGANILEKGTTNGVQSDFDGNFSIEVSDENATLEVSYIGYATKTVALNGQTSLNIELVASAAGLDEVVVIGYGTVRKSDLTGSVSTIDSEALESRPLANFADAIQGNSSGVAVTSAGGAPGSSPVIRIRGIGSINSSVDPLYVVDGQPYLGDLNSINPNDIQSLEILKDASSTAIYGSRGSNGVVLITTKRGTASKLEFGFNSTMGIQSQIDEYDVLNRDEYVALRNDIATNDGFELPFPAGLDISSLPDTDWQDVFNRDAIIQTYQFYARGGNEKVRFYMSANYTDQEGTVIQSDFKRGALTANLDANITDRFSIGNSLTISRQGTNGVTGFAGLGSNEGIRTLVGPGIAGASPVIEGFNPDGTISDVVDTFNDRIDSPLLGTLNVQEEFVNQTIGNIYLKYDLADGLSAKSSLGFTVSDTDIRVFLSSEVAGTNGGFALRRSITSTNWVSTTQLDFNKTYGKHSINAVAVAEFQEFKETRFDASSQTFVLDNLLFNSLQSGSNPQIPSSNANSFAIASYLGRANYVFDNRYFLTASGRYDGSSRLAQGRKYQFFPSVAAKWKVSNEAFMSDVDFISDLNFGASYGETGSQGIASFTTLPQLAPDQAIIGENSDINIGFSPQNFANPLLTWEIAKQLDVGVDFGLFNGRVRSEISYFTKDTEGLFFNRPLPGIVGTNATNTLTNIGSINNNGIEIDVNATVVQTEDFSWNVSANFTKLNNQILKLSETDTLQSGVGGTVGFGIGSQLLIEGDQLGHFFGLETDGLYDGSETLTFNNSTRQAGDIKYIDQNGDGNITVDDRVFLGYGIADKFWGLTNTFKYKGLSLTTFFQGSHGNKIANYTKYGLDNISRNTNGTTELLDRWTPTNTDTNIPRVTLEQPYTFSDALLEDGDYVRLKTITLAYNFTRDALDRLKGVTSLNIYATGTNLFTWTDYTGLDPDVTAASTAANQGYDNGGFPAAKSIVLGLNIAF